MLDTIRELGIAFVAYSPIGRGLISGRITNPNDLDADDTRRNAPRFSEQNISGNLQTVDKIAEIAEAKGISAAQIAIAWVLSQPNVVTIPGTKRRTYLEENVAAAEVVLTQEDLASLDSVAPAGIAMGERYPAAGMKGVHL